MGKVQHRQSNIGRQDIHGSQVVYQGWSSIERAYSYNAEK